MRHGCLVTNLKSTFDSLICESKTKALKCTVGSLSKCRCNILTIGDKAISDLFRFIILSIRKFLSPLKSVSEEFAEFPHLALRSCFSLIYCVRSRVRFCRSRSCKVKNIVAELILSSMNEQSRRHIYE